MAFGPILYEAGNLLHVQPTPLSSVVRERQALPSRATGVVLEELKTISNIRDQKHNTLNSHLANSTRPAAAVDVDKTPCAASWPFLFVAPMYELTTRSCTFTKPASSSQPWICRAKWKFAPVAVKTCFISSRKSCIAGPSLSSMRLSASMSWIQPPGLTTSKRRPSAACAAGPAPTSARRWCTMSKKSCHFSGHGSLMFWM